MNKEKAIDAINKMPEDFNLDELIERLIVIEKLDVAAQQVKEGEVVYHSEVRKKIDEWKRR